MDLITKIVIFIDHSCFFSAYDIHGVLLQILQLRKLSLLVYSTSISRFRIVKKTFSCPDRDRERLFSVMCLSNGWKYAIPFSNIFRRYSNISLVDKKALAVQIGVNVNCLIAKDSVLHFFSLFSDPGAVTI